MIDAASKLDFARQAFDLGRFADARRAAFEVLQDRPDRAEAHFILGRCAIRNGEHIQAAALFRSAATLAPHEPRYPAFEAASLIAASQVQAARAAADRAMALGPREPATLDALGVIYVHTGNFQKAATAFRRAGVIDANEPRYPAAEASALTMTGDLAEALRAADRASNLAPTNPEVLETLGRAYTRLGRHKAAVVLLREAARAASPSLTLLYHLAYAEQFVGDFDAAKRVFGEIIAIDPDAGAAYLALVHLQRQTPEQNSIGELERIFDEQKSDPEHTLINGFALAKSCEDLGQYDEALAWLAKAKAGFRGRRPMSMEATADAFEAAAATITPDSRAHGRFASEEPIFIVGLPRTGTTLVERILGSHPDVTTGEELPTFSLLVQKAAGAPGRPRWDATTFRAAPGIDPRKLGADYVESTRPVTGDSARFTDKQPFNFLYAGLIHRALPQARIICLRRDPMDSCLNNYRQMFTTVSPWHDYSYDLEDTARYYVLFDRLMAHWRKVLPADRFTEVGYERLVSDPKAETWRLLDFCGLSRDAGCLAFHENTKGVSTASVMQVRQPVHTRSIGRWRQWSERLDPIRRILEDAGIAVELPSCQWGEMPPDNMDFIAPADSPTTRKSSGTSH